MKENPGYFEILNFISDQHQKAKAVYWGAMGDEEKAEAKYFCSIWFQMDALIQKGYSYSNGLSEPPAPVPIPASSQPVTNSGLVIAPKMPHTVQCLQCNKPFYQSRKGAKFCSDVCKMRHHRAKKSTVSSQQSTVTPDIAPAVTPVGSAYIQTDIETVIQEQTAISEPYVIATINNYFKENGIDQKIETDPDPPEEEYPYPEYFEPQQVIDIFDSNIVVGQLANHGNETVTFKSNKNVIDYIGLKWFCVGSVGTGYGGTESVTLCQIHHYHDKTVKDLPYSYSGKSVRIDGVIHKLGTRITIRLKSDPPPPKPQAESNSPAFKLPIPPQSEFRGHYEFDQEGQCTNPDTVFRFISSLLSIHIVVACYYNCWGYATEFQTMPVEMERSPFIFQLEFTARKDAIRAAIKELEPYVAKSKKKIDKTTFEEYEAFKLKYQ